jgi:hypothetical protein
MRIKLLSGIFFSLFISNPIFSQTLNWSNEITVANGNMYGDIRPRIAVTANNIPVIMWGGGVGTQPLYVARWNGSGFGTPVQVTPMNVDPFIDTWAGADMAANGNTVFVVFKVQPEMTNNIYIVKSTDGGVTWSMPTQVDNGTGPYDRFPTVAVTSNGNPAVMMMTFDTTFMIAGYGVTNSTNGGTTFPMPVNVSNLGSSNVCDCCPGYIEVNGNNQACTWRRNNNNLRDMWAGVSTNSGMTFPTGFDVDNTDWMLSACPSTGPDPYLWSDSLFTVFMSGASGDDRVYLSTYNITSAMQDYIVPIAPNYPSAAIQNYPFIAGSNDTVGVVWQQNLSGNTDSYFTYSTTGSSGLINNEMIVHNSTAGNQKNPHIAYSQNKFHICWVDEVTGNVMYKYATLSPNGIADPATQNVSITAFPNPSNENMMINLSALQHHNGVLNVYDVAGKIIETKNLSGEQTVSLEKQTAGIYFVTVTDAITSKTFTTKIIFY